MLDLSPIEIAAPLVALAGLLLYLHLGPKQYGPRADWWETLRRTVLPQLNRLAQRNGWGYAAYTLSPEEYIGTSERPPEMFEQFLSDHGFKRMPLAAYKYEPEEMGGKGEVGSWAYRGSMLATRQDHLILFEAPSGGTDVYGHSEYNAYNPLTAAQHYLGVNYVPLGSVSGIERVERFIEERYP